MKTVKWEMCWKRLVGSRLEIFQGQNVEGVLRKISSHNSMRFLENDCGCIKTNGKKKGIRSILPSVG